MHPGALNWKESLGRARCAQLQEGSMSQTHDNIVAAERLSKRGKLGLRAGPTMGAGTAPLHNNRKCDARGLSFQLLNARASIMGLTLNPKP